jgi:hypothetical protein
MNVGFRGAGRPGSENGSPLHRIGNKKGTGIDSASFCTDDDDGVVGSSTCDNLV